MRDKETAMTFFSLGVLLGMIFAFAACTPDVTNTGKVESAYCNSCSDGFPDLIQHGISRAHL
jgi:hypothetical protein